MAQLEIDPPNKRRKLASAAAVALPANSSAATAPQQVQRSPEQNRQQLPIDTAGRHDFEYFARHLQDAAMLIYRKMEKAPFYADASVLLLRWEQDMTVEHELSTLEMVFREKYSYHTDRWVIPTVPNPSIKLSVQMAGLLENARSDHLLIIYYAGHGYIGPDEQLYWASSTREDAYKVKWSGIRCLLEDASLDILFLLDTCAIDDAPLAGTHGVKQAIAAYTPDQNGADHGTHSFTTHLVDSLQKLSSGTPFSVQRLYDEILCRRRQDLTARLSNGGMGKTHVKRMPTFFPLTPGTTQNRTLAPVRSKHTFTHNTETKGGTGFGPLPDLTFDNARVLVCTTFQDDANPDMMFYNQWLQKRSPTASKITMEGMFLGPPTMFLISMPQSAWNVFQDDNVCCFLGYINSHNMIGLYNGLINSSPVPLVSHMAVENGHVLLEAREEADRILGTKTRHEATPKRVFHYSDQPMRQEAVPRRMPLPSSAPSARMIATTALERDGDEQEAGMKDTAPQHRPLSHVRHINNGVVSNTSSRKRPPLTATHRLQLGTDLNGKAYVRPSYEDRLVYSS